MRVININVGGISVILISLGGTPVICRLFNLTALPLYTIWQHFLLFAKTIFMPCVYNQAIRVVIEVDVKVVEQ
jgi:hypothetical protein